MLPFVDMLITFYWMGSALAGSMLSFGLNDVGLERWNPKMVRAKK